MTISAQSTTCPSFWRMVFEESTLSVFALSPSSYRLRTNTPGFVQQAIQRLCRQDLSFA